MQDDGETSAIAPGTLFGPRLPAAAPKRRVDSRRRTRVSRTLAGSNKLLFARVRNAQVVRAVFISQRHDHYIGSARARKSYELATWPALAATPH